MQAMPISRVDGGDLLIWRMTSIILGLHLTMGLARVSKLCSASITLRCGEDATLPWTFADEGSLSAASPSRGQGMERLGEHNSPRLGGSNGQHSCQMSIYGISSAE